jgi:hypothetical protein
MAESGKTCEVLGAGVRECPRCGGTHQFHFRNGLPKEPKIYIPCPRVTRFYRLAEFYVDSTPNVLDEEQILAQIQDMHGARDLEEKLARWREVRRPGLWLIFEYREMAEEVMQADIQGLHYPALTGACCLAERVMNRLLFGLKEHYKRSAHYKRIHDKSRVQNWAQLRKILRDWRVIDSEQAGVIKKLHSLRTDAVHYVKDYDYEEAAAEAIRLVLQLIDSLFFAFDRKDIFWVFRIPGEIWVREDKQDAPFVKEFVLPLCHKAGATMLYFEAEGYKEDGALVGPMTEDEFIERRKSYLADPSKYDDGKTPQEFSIEFQGETRTFVVP